MKTKIVDNFPNYIITDDGRVFNQKGKELKPDLSNNGYLRVSLSNNTVSHQKFLVHRLVAKAFISNPNDYPQVNHINEIKTDNRVENLEWCTPLENLNHSGIIDKASIAKFTKVHCDTTNEDFNSIKEASEKYHLNHANIVSCCKGNRKTAGEKKWSYIND